MVGVVRWTAWVLSGALALVLLTIPVSTQAQLALSLAVVAAMILIWAFARGPWVRQVLLALGSFVVLRYLYWRTTSTLPSIYEPVDFIPGFILYLAEIYCFLILAISLIINVDPLKRKPLEKTDDDKLPTVDVFIPTYNEDEYILATTMAAAKSMDYPAHKLTVWLLDDGGTDQKCNDPNPEKAAAARARRASLQFLCAQMGCRYQTRARNEHAKAGNMNNGMKFSKGELIVVFDADHAPFRAFLSETVGHFLKDPKLFLVQTPHVFLNPDPIEKNLRTFHRMPSENEMFYSVTQCGLDKWDGSFFCGSAAVLRREALEQTGGFSGITITEDCETAFELHARGWHSVFVDKPLIAGLQPETFTSFIGQRSRWLQGMFQILMLKNPALKRGLKPIQRIAYLSSMTFWFFPLPRLIFMVAPLLYIFFDIKIFVANIDETIAFTVGYMIVNVMLQNYLYGKVRWPWVSELYEYVQGVYLSKAMATVIMSPRKPTFNVTAKGLTLDNDHLSELSWPFFAIWGLLVFAGVTALLRYAFDPGVNSLIIVVSIWNLFNLIIAGAALGAVAERRQPDRHPRLGITRTGTLRVGGIETPVKVVDVSAGGCAVRPAEGANIPALAPGALAVLRIDAVGKHAGDRELPLVCNRCDQGDKGPIVGFEFGEMQPAHYYVLADLMYGDSDALPRFLMSRRNHMNILQGSAVMVKWGLTEPFRAIAYALKKTPAAEAKPDAQPAAAEAAASPQATQAIAQERAALERDEAALGIASDEKPAPAASPAVAASAPAPAAAVAMPSPAAETAKEAAIVAVTEPAMVAAEAAASVEPRTAAPVAEAAKANEQVNARREPVPATAQQAAPAAEPAAAIQTPTPMPAQADIASLIAMLSDLARSGALNVKPAATAPAQPVAAPAEGPSGPAAQPVPETAAAASPPAQLAVAPSEPAVPAIAAPAESVPAAAIAVSEPAPAQPAEPAEVHDTITELRRLLEKARAGESRSKTEAA